MMGTAAFNFVYAFFQDLRQSGADIPLQLIEYKPDDYFTEERLSYRYQYCKFGNFRENFILAKSVKNPICDVKN